jgi:rhomboid family GlyGly-CTERM serine protease
MNADTPMRGLGQVLKSLNCDRRHGWALVAACLVLALPELGGEPVRALLRYERSGLAQGEWWRLLTAHFVHLDAEHAILNGLGVILMWALFARDYSPLRWLAIYLFSALVISAGLWWLNPDVDWYVGASGALHGVMAAGTLAHLRRRDLDGWILAIFVLVKLGYEQFAGSMPFAGDSNTLVDAHLYGAVGGLVLAFFLRSRREPV